MVDGDGQGVVNLYLCEECNTAQCLACGVVAVTQHHFYSQVQLNEFRIFGLVHSKLC